MSALQTKDLRTLLVLMMIVMKTGTNSKGDEMSSRMRWNWENVNADGLHLYPKGNIRSGNCIVYSSVVMSYAKGIIDISIHFDETKFLSLYFSCEVYPVAGYSCFSVVWKQLGLLLLPLSPNPSLFEVCWRYHWAPDDVMRLVLSKETARTGPTLDPLLFRPEGVNPALVNPACFEQVSYFLFCLFVHLFFFRNLLFYSCGKSKTNSGWLDLTWQLCIDRGNYDPSALPWEKQLLHNNFHSQPINPTGHEKSSP